MHWWRIGIAIALAPAAVPLMYGVGILLGSEYPYSGPGAMEKHLLSTAALMALSYPVSIGLGVPIVASLYFTQRLTGLNCVAWALVAGAAASIVFRWIVDRPGHEAPLSQSVTLAVAFAAIGGLTALVFCLIAGLKMRQYQQRGGQRPIAQKNVQ